MERHRPVGNVHRTSSGHRTSLAKLSVLHPYPRSALLLTVGNVHRTSSGHRTSLAKLLSVLHLSSLGPARHCRHYLAGPTASICLCALLFATGPGWCVFPDKHRDFLLWVWIDCVATYKLLMEESFFKTITGSPLLIQSTKLTNNSLQVARGKLDQFERPTSLVTLDRRH